MDEEQDREGLMKEFDDYIESNPSIKTSLGKEEEHLIVDFRDILNSKPDLAQYIIDYPDDSILLCKDIMRGHNELDLEIRFQNFESISTNILPIREIRSKHINRMLSFKGVIKQMSGVKPVIQKIKCACPACETERVILSKNNIIDLKTRCGCGFRGTFREIRREYVDMQRMILEEDVDVLEGSQQPKRVNVLLSKGLTKTKFDVMNTPGAKVFITAIVREIPTKMENKNLAEREFLLEANYISPIEGTYESLIITEEDEEEILELSKDPDLMQKLVDSFAMDIYGYKEVKESIILCDFGGTPKFSGKDELKRRGDFHILLIGPPGIGKSKIAKNTKDIAPKYRYSSAARGSGTGYTAAVIKDEFLGTWALEVGALVLASGGICIIDELEQAKDEDLGKLLEVLSEGTITIDKANIHCSLKSRTSVIACANPKYIRFDPTEDLSRQLNLPLNILNRIDLIFPIMDIQDEGTDKQIAQTIVDAHTREFRPKIPYPLIRKYVAYAKSRIRPRLTEAAKKNVINTYMEMRKRKRIMEGLEQEDTPGLGKSEDKIVQISPRQCEAIIRLAEAYAKSRLSDDVLVSDVDKAKKLLLFSLGQVAIDIKKMPDGTEERVIDTDILETGRPVSFRDNTQIVLKIIHELSDKLNKLVPIEDIIREAGKKGITEDKTDDILEYLKWKTGDIFFPKHNLVSLT